MGGYGSGHRFFSKATTDHALRLDVRWLAREGIIRPGVLVSTSLHWTRNSKPDGDIRVRYDAGRPDQLGLDYYRTRGSLDAEWTDVHEIVALDRTPCHYGGERVWRRCTGCGSRRGALYSRHGRFLRVPCNRLAYAVTREDRLGPLFHVAIVSGLRQGELFGLRWEDVDPSAGTLFVRHALQRIDGAPTLVEPKTALSLRTVTLPASAVAALRVQKDRQTFERAHAGDLWHEGGFVFTSTMGTPLNPSNVDKRLKSLLAGAGLPRQRFHDLRHCAASLLLAGGVAPRMIMGILGHSQISLTMNTYAHLSPALERDAARALDSVLGVAETG